MKRCRCVAIETLVMLCFAAVALAFQTAVRLSAGDSTAPPAACSDGRLTASTRALIPNSYRPARWCCTRVASRDGGNKNNRVVMMGRSNRLKTVIARQRTLEKSNAPVILSEKAKRKAKRERRAYFRERYACSGRRLIKLQQEDPDSLYIGFVGTNGAGRAQALGAVEAYLKRATEFKVAKHHKGNAKIKLVDAGNMCLSEMKGKGERKLSLLRHCDLLVHVVRCFDLFEPKPFKPWRGAGREEEDRPGDEVDEAPATQLLSNLGGGVKQGGGDGEEVEEEIDWPLSPTPLEDIKETRAEMAYADLQFIEERHKTNHTKWFWRNRNRALNEKAAIALVTPLLEDAYASGGVLEPVGTGFRNSCLRDEPGENGTTLYRSKRRAAIEEIGFLTPKPVVYVANVPSEAAPSSDEDDDANDDAEPKEASESGEAVRKVALAHADKVVSLKRDYGAPVVVGCLRNPEGQNALGAAVFKAIPRDFLSRDPKLRKSASSPRSKTQQRTQQRRRPGVTKAPRTGAVPA
ncbi:unnamed protein product [Ectocarpus sp. 6 AP-2014]